MQTFIHYFLHLIFPAIIALAFYRHRWLRAWAVLLATMLVDLDHLLADPIYAPCRCSIGYHPLHSYYAIAAYLIGLIPRRTRLIALGLLLHMVTDALDCYMSRVYC